MASVSLLDPHAVLDTVGVIGTSALGYAGAARWTFAAGCLAASWAWLVDLALAGRRPGAAALADDRLARPDLVPALVVRAVAAYVAWRLVATLGA